MLHHMFLESSPNSIFKHFSKINNIPSLLLKSLNVLAWKVYYF